jgi:hypothetical protein
VVGGLGAQAVGLRERGVEVAQVAEIGEGGELVDDRVGPRGGDGGDDRVAIERVEDHRVGTGVAQRAGLGRRSGRRRHLVAGREELWEQLGAEGAGRAGEEDAHRGVSFAVMTPETRWPCRT